MRLPVRGQAARQETVGSRMGELALLHALAAVYLNTIAPFGQALPATERNMPMGGFPIPASFKRRPAVQHLPAGAAGVNRGRGTEKRDVSGGRFARR